MTPLDWTSCELDQLHAAGLRRHRRVVQPLADAWCLVDGRRLRNFAANDYLNLAHDPRVQAAAARVLIESGVGAGASALVSGRTQWHAALEERLARFEGAPAAILFPTGFAANVGTICALVGPGDNVYCDRLNHASLVDGCRLSGARLRVYRHDSLERLEAELRQPAKGRRLIVSDGVFSMDGDLAPLSELCDLADRFRAMLLVDEAHATGVFGEHGRGVAELQRVENRGIVRVGTLSKAVGTMGGFVTGSQELVDWLWNRARSQIYSTALPPSICAAAACAIDLIETESWRRKRLLGLAAEFREILSTNGVAVAPGACGPIVPVLLSSPQRAVEIAAELEERGYLVGAIRPPSVPRGTSRLRITLSCAHTPEELSELARVLKEMVGP